MRASHRFIFCVVVRYPSSFIAALFDLLAVVCAFKREVLTPSPSFRDTAKRNESKATNDELPHGLPHAKNERLDDITLLPQW